MTGELTAEHRALRDQFIAESNANGAAVVDIAGNEKHPPYAFTVGAWRRFHIPEAVTIGLPPGAGEFLVRNYVRRAGQGEEFAPGTVWDDLLEGVLVTVEKVSKGHYFTYFGSVFLLHPDGDFDAVQLITSTRDDMWPWEPDAPEGFGLWQPVLTASHEPESWTPGVDGP
jgi:hypothetical protein